VESGKRLEIEDIPDDIFKGLTIVVTGMFENITREKVEALVMAKGGRKTGSVSGKTNYLVAGYKLEDGRETSESSKYKKALSLNVKILTEQGLEELIAKLCKVDKFSFAKEQEEFVAGLEKEAGVDLVVQEEAKATSNEMWTDLYKPR